MIKHSILLFLLTTLMCFFVNNSTLAATYTGTGRGTYTKIANQKKDVAEQYALYYAMREAAEKISVYVASQSLSKNGKIESDDIYLATAAIMKVTKKEVNWVDKETVVVDIASQISDKENIQIAKLLQENSQLIVKQKQIYDNYERILRENKELAKQINTASEETKNDVEKKILDNDIYFITEIYFQKALNAFMQKNYDDAHLEIDTAISMDDTYANAYALKAEIYMETQQYNEAFKYFSIAEQKDPSLTEIYVNRGLIYERTNRYSEALYEFNRALEKDPKEVMALSHKGHIYFQQGNYNASIAEFTKALNIMPTDLNSLMARGMSYAYAGDYSHSLEDFNSIIRIHPNDPTGYTMRGFLLAMLHNYDAAKDNIDRAIMLNPDPQLQQIITYTQGVINKQEK